MGRKLLVNLSDIADALDNASYEQIYVLDLETGQVLWTTTDETSEVEEIYAQLEGTEVDDGAFEAALDTRDLPDWRKDSLREAARIEAGFGTRYRRIEVDDPHAGYRDMEAFIDTVENAELQRRLERAISGRGAFRYFKDVLYDYPAERERWFQFKDDCSRQRALEWLEGEGIEPISE
jgi:hypothetical protein